MQLIRRASPEFDQTRITERPDGFYWQSKSGGREYGPFETLLDTIQDMQGQDETSFEPGETVEEAKAEIGIAEWTDPDTGEPAEEDGLRIEEH
ncbi:MAG: hypothetical protein ACXWIP_22500 [Burkholderiales bacterium]